MREALLERPIARIVILFGRARSEVGTDDVDFWPHLQKYSRAGIMLNLFKRGWPFCLHVWFFWKKQEQKTISSSTELQWVPGTEKGFYARTPGYREGKDGIEWTNGYLGMHFD